MIKYRKCIFAVVFFKDSPTQFLMLHRTKNWRGWEFAKGGIKEGEKEPAGLKREIKEETGAKRIKVVAKTMLFVKYRYSRKFMKDNVLFSGAKGYVFLVQIFDKKVKIDRSEHDRYLWTSYDQARKMLTFKEQKDALKYVSKRYNL